MHMWGRVDTANIALYMQVVVIWLPDYVKIRLENGLETYITDDAKKMSSSR